ncbi:hypothetical protein HanRHA438_Chr17g0816811 [Helianthus annuus]|nr:hypothetical protein HanRHA438_Chr17g0816811 [Helianthus annuus]
MFRFPANFNNKYALAFEPLDFTFHDFHRFLNEVHRVINKNFIKRYVEVLINQTLFEIGHVEGWMNISKFGR